MEKNNALAKIYNHATETIKNAILNGQYQAAKGVNRVQIFTYLTIGKYVSQNTRCGVWGSGALKAISERLRKLIPGLRGFGETQLREMRLFYEGWSFIDSNSSVATDEFALNNSSVATDELQRPIGMKDMVDLVKIE